MGGGAEERRRKGNDNDATVSWRQREEDREEGEKKYEPDVPLTREGSLESRSTWGVRVLVVGRVGGLEEGIEGGEGRRVGRVESWVGINKVGS